MTEHAADLLADAAGKRIREGEECIAVAVVIGGCQTLPLSIQWGFACVLAEGL